MFLDYVAVLRSWKVLAISLRCPERRQKAFFLQHMTICFYPLAFVDLVLHSSEDLNLMSRNCFTSAFNLDNQHKLIESSVSRESVRDVDGKTIPWRQNGAAVYKGVAR